MLVEELVVAPCRRWKGRAGKARHDLQKNRGMVFRLRLSFQPLDPDTLERLTKTRERAALQKARDLIRA